MRERERERERAFINTTIPLMKRQCQIKLYQMIKFNYSVLMPNLLFETFFKCLVSQFGGFPEEVHVFKKTGYDLVSAHALIN